MIVNWVRRGGTHGECRDGENGQDFIFTLQEDTRIGIIEGLFESFEGVNGISVFGVGGKCSGCLLENHVVIATH